MRGGISQRESVWLGGEQGLGEGDELIEPRWEGEVAADTGVALEVVDVLDFVGPQQVDDGWGGVPTGMGKGVGLGNEAIEDVPTERLNGKGEQEEGIFAFEGHLKSALGGGGVVHLAVPKRGQGLTQQSPVGEAFFDDEDAWGHGHGRIIAGSKEMSRLGVRSFKFEVFRFKRRVRGGASNS
jgi:hypothetical protein